MTIQLTRSAMRQIFPRAPQAVIDADWQTMLDGAGITHTRTRLSYFLGNIEHECGGFTIPKLTENINYTAARMAAVWPNRFASAAAVVAKYGSAPGWQRRAFDDIYGNRMGNRPGTSDGSTFIGHGGPQWTGRDGHEALARILKDLIPGLAKLTAEQAIVYAIDNARQPEVCAAFWIWKGLNKYADTGNFKGAVKVWNGGSNGLADRLQLMAGNDPIIARLANVEKIMPVAKQLPGSPPTPAPPPEAIADATAGERKTRTASVATAIAGGGHEAVKTSTTVPVQIVPPVVAYSAAGIGIVVFVVASVMIAKKKAAVIANWF